MPFVQEFGFSEIEKVRLITENQNKIAGMYKSISKEAAKRAKTLNGSMLISDKMRKQYLDDYVKELGKKVDVITKAIESNTTSTMTQIAQTVVNANNDFMGRIGMKLEGAFFHVPENVVNRLVTGQVYKGNWNFSKALWKQGDKVKADMYDVVAKGIAGQKSTFDIAKDLEKYLNPSARKNWDWSKVYPGSNKTVDYSAQRLARTLSQHAYQVAFRETLKKNPFVEYIEWHSAGIHGRTCAICFSRDGEHFKIGSEPLDHPNGLCYYTAVLEKSMDQIANEIGDWANGKSNPALDAYYKDAMAQKASLSGLILTKQKSLNPITMPISSKYKVSNIRNVPKLERQLTGPNSLPRTPFNRSRVDGLLDRQFSRMAPGGYSDELKPLHDAWASGLSELEKKSVYNYTYQWDQRMNQYLRGITKDISDEARMYMENVKSALSKAKLPEDLGVVRSGDQKSLLNMTGLMKEAKKTAGGMKGWLEANYQDLVGKVAGDEGFLSTSAKKSGGLLASKAGSIEYKILLPQGTNAMYIAPTSHFVYEQEVLVQAGSKFIIRDVLPPEGKKKTWTVYMELLVK